MNGAVCRRAGLSSSGAGAGGARPASRSRRRRAARSGCARAAARRPPARRRRRRRRRRARCRRRPRRAADLWRRRRAPWRRRARRRGVAAAALAAAAAAVTPAFSRARGEAKRRSKVGAVHSSDPHLAERRSDACTAPAAASELRRLRSVHRSSTMVDDLWTMRMVARGRVARARRRAHQHRWHTYTQKAATPTATAAAISSCSASSQPSALVSSGAGQAAARRSAPSARSSASIVLGGWPSHNGAVAPAAQIAASTRPSSDAVSPVVRSDETTPRGGAPCTTHVAGGGCASKRPRNSARPSAAFLDPMFASLLRSRSPRRRARRTTTSPG